MQNDLYKEIDEFVKNERARVLNYFIKKTNGSEFDAEDMAQNSFISFFLRIQTGKYPPDKWTHLLNKIIMGEKHDAVKTAVKNKETITDDFSNFSDSNKTISSLMQEDNSQLDIHLIRGTCLSPHRALQEVILINETTNLNKLQKDIFKMYPLLEERCNSRGSKCDIINKDEILSIEDRDIINDFSAKIIDIAKKLEINDPIGINGLKIVLCSKNKWHDLYMLSKSTHNKHYSTFDNDGNLVKKRSLKNSSTLFLRDFMYYKTGLIKLIKFLNYSAEKKYPDCIVSLDYITKYYRINTLDGNILKKQKWGRSNKDGIIKRIDKYNKLISDIDFI